MSFRKHPNVQKPFKKTLVLLSQFYIGCIKNYSLAMIHHEANNFIDITKDKNKRRGKLNIQNIQMWYVLPPELEGQ